MPLAPPKPSAIPPLVVAPASASGGSHALLRFAGAGLASWLTERFAQPLRPWRVSSGPWPVAGGQIPARLLWCPGPRSFTGEDLAELTVPGSPVLVQQLLDECQQQGAAVAEPGYFTRRAYANGRLRLDQAEGLLALVHAEDAPAAQRALQLLRGSLGAEVQALRQDLLHLRALVEAGLDFMEEADVRAYEPAAMQQQLTDLAARLGRWTRAAQAQDQAPLVVLAGPANAGKSALFNALTGARALVSEQPGTTRDWLDAPWQAGSRRVRLLDTAGWLDNEGASAGELDQQAVARGRQQVAAASLVLWCTAPDAPLPEQLPSVVVPQLVIATKADQTAVADARVACSCSALAASGLLELGKAVQQQLGENRGLPQRQYELLRQAEVMCSTLARGTLPPDELLAADLGAAASALHELLGAQSSDEILGAIFSQFCIGK